MTIGLVGTATAAPGDLDLTFGDGNDGFTVSEYATEWNDTVVQTDGKILTAGYVEGIEGGRDTVLARYRTDGTLDPTFGGGDGYAVYDFSLTDESGQNMQDYAKAIAVQADGKILTAGYVQTVTSGAPQFDTIVARYKADGTLDEGFGNGGRSIDNLGEVADGGRELKDGADSIAVQANGSIVVTGMAQGEDTLVARYGTSGMLDQAFGNGGYSVVSFSHPDSRGEDYAYSVAVQSDGKVVIAGVSRDESDRDNPLIARFTSAGLLDDSFGDSGSTIFDTTESGSYWDGLFAVAIQPDGKIVAAGYSDNEEESTRSLLVRLSADGTLDPGFGPSGVGYGVYNIGGVAQNEDGFGLDDELQDLTLQSDGKIIAAGSAGEDTSVARFSASGALDTTFSGDGYTVANLAGTAEGVNLEDLARAVALQSDGKVVTVGRVQRAGDVLSAVVARFEGSPGEPTCATVSQTTAPAGYRLIKGTSGANVLNGTAGKDVILGLGGNDIINGNGGDDLICTGTGTDTVKTGSGNDRIEAGNGTNTISSGAGNDTIITGSGPVDTIDAGAGNDNVNAGSGLNIINGGAGTDTCAPKAAITAGCEK